MIKFSVCLNRLVFVIIQYISYSKAHNIVHIYMYMCIVLIKGPSVICDHDVQKDSEGDM